MASSERPDSSQRVRFVSRTALEKKDTKFGSDLNNNQNLLDVMKLKAL